MQELSTINDDRLQAYLAGRMTLAELATKMTGREPFVIEGGQVRALTEAQYAGRLKVAPPCGCKGNARHGTPAALLPAPPPCPACAQKLIARARAHLAQVAALLCEAEAQMGSQWPAAPASAPVPVASPPQPVPVPDSRPAATIVWYTGGTIEPRLRDLCLANVREIAGRLGYRLITVGRETGYDLCDTSEAAGIPGMLSQLRAGAHASALDGYVFAAEHDVLYSAEHFALPADPTAAVFRYDEAVIRMSRTDAWLCDRPLLLGASAPRSLWLAALAVMVPGAAAGSRKGPNDCEPGMYRGDPWRAETWRASAWSVDVRHGENLTAGKRPEGARAAATVPGMGHIAGVRARVWPELAKPARAVSGRVVRAIWIPRLRDSRLAKSLAALVADAGYTLDSRLVSEGYGALHNSCTDLATWGVKWAHDRYGIGKHGVLYLENGLLGQGSGCYADSTPGGYFGHSSIVSAREYDSPPDEWEEVKTHLRTVLGVGHGEHDPAGPILIVLQTAEDAPIQHYFPIRNEARPSVLELLHYCRLHLPADVPAIIRPHPKDDTWSTLEPAVAHHNRNRPLWQVTRGGSVYEVAKKCRAVVTVNSTVATECLVTGIPTAVLGRSAFTGSGAVLDCSVDPARLADLATFHPEPMAIARYLCAVWRHTLPYGASVVQLRECQAVARWLDNLSDRGPE
jgi:hypothetical protein